MLFQVHLWSGITLGLYILMISVTGSVLVYRNELYMAATPALIISKGSGPRLTDGELAEAAIRSYPGYRVARIVRARNPDQAVDIWLGRAGKPRSGYSILATAMTSVVRLPPASGSSRS